MSHLAGWGVLLARTLPSASPTLAPSSHTRVCSRALGDHIISSLVGRTPLYLGTFFTYEARQCDISHSTWIQRTKVTDGQLLNSNARRHRDGQRVSVVRQNAFMFPALRYQELGESQRRTRRTRKYRKRPPAQRERAS